MLNTWGDLLQQQRPPCYTAASALPDFGQYKSHYKYMLSLQQTCMPSTSLMDNPLRESSTSIEPRNKNNIAVVNQTILPADQTIWQQMIIVILLIKHSHTSYTSHCKACSLLSSSLQRGIINLWTWLGRSYRTVKF